MHKHRYNDNYSYRITGGVPPPIVTWQGMKKGDKAFSDIVVQGEELIMNTLTLEDAGQYRCIATNPLDRITKTIGKSLQIFNSIDCHMISVNAILK